MKKLPISQIKKHFDEFLSFYYNAPCSGCPKGHSSFWRAVIESPEWKAWKKVGHYDFAECEALGICSSSHWKDFVKFILTSKPKRKGRK